MRVDELAAFERAVAEGDIDLIRRYAGRIAGLARGLTEPEFKPDTRAVYYVHPSMSFRLECQPPIVHEGLRLLGLQIAFGELYSSDDSPIMVALERDRTDLVLRMRSTRPQTSPEPRGATRTEDVPVMSNQPWMPSSRSPSEVPDPSLLEGRTTRRAPLPSESYDEICTCGCPDTSHVVDARSNPPDARRCTVCACESFDWEGPGIQDVRADPED